MDTKALRQKILDLAIRGKLVPQDPNDEPASVLLERIREQKKQMVKDGKLKPKDIKNDTIIFKGDDNLHYEKFQDDTVKCIEDEIPFDVPDNWEWCRFGSYTLNRDNERKPVSSVQRKKVKKIYDYYGASGVIDQTDSFLFDEELLLIGEDGANLLARTKPIAFLANGKYWVNNHAHCIDSIDKRLLEFICIYINAINLFQYITGSAQPKLNQDNMNRILIPIPPKAEQEKILERIKIILSNINYINLLKGKLQSDIANAKSKILDLAIRGKLVPQDSNDEPASVLLERIRAEKEELIKQGKIKRNKKESVIFKGDDNSYYEKFEDNTVQCIDNEIPFEVPNCWKWCRLSNVGTTNIGLTYKPTNIDTDGTIVLRSCNIKDGNILLNDLVRVNSHIRENQFIHEGDILICARNGSRDLIGKCAIMPQLSEKISFGAFMAVYRSICNQYVYYYFNTTLFRNSFSNDDSKQINQVTQAILHNTLIPLPPFEEQLRIVTKLKEIINLLNLIALDGDFN